MGKNDLIKELLNSSKIAERKKGVNLIKKNDVKDVGDELFTLLKKELEKDKSWELIVLIIETLGIIQYKNAISLFEEICKKNQEHDMITREVAKAYCKIVRSDEFDVDPEIYLLSFGRFSVVNGALLALGHDKVVPSQESQNKILRILNQLNFKRERGYSDVRVGLALACAGWNKTTEIKSFLEDCLGSDYLPLQKIAKNSLKNKYSSI